MRAILTKVAKSFDGKNKVFLGLLAFLVFVPSLCFAYDFGIGNAIKEVILGLAGALYAIGFALVKMGISYTKILIGDQTIIPKVWGDVKNLCLEFFGMVILVIAFMNLLKIQIDQWGVNRLIPRLFLAIFLVIFSKFIAISIINFSSALAGSFVSLAMKGSPNPDLFAGFSELGHALTGVKADQIGFPVAFGILLVSFISFLVLVVLAVILFLRAAILAFMIIIAPIAFLLMVLPLTQKYSTEWWTWFIKWTFFFPICILIIAIGMRLTKIAGAPDALNTAFGVSQGNESGGGFLTQFSGMIIGLIAIPIGIVLPLKMLGAVGKAISGGVTGKSSIPGMPIDPKAIKDSFGGKDKAQKKTDRVTRARNKGIPGLRNLTSTKYGEQNPVKRAVSGRGKHQVGTAHERSKAAKNARRVAGSLGMDPAEMYEEANNIARGESASTSKGVAFREGLKALEGGNAMGGVLQMLSDDDRFEAATMPMGPANAQGVRTNPGGGTPDQTKRFESFHRTTKKEKSTRNEDPSKNYTPR